MIKTEVTDGVAVLTLAHGKANALDIEFCSSLASHFVELRTSNVKAAVLTGQGNFLCRR